MALLGGGHLLQLGDLVWGGVDLCLEPRLDHVERAGDDARETTCRRAGEKLQRHADFAALLVYAGPGVELLPEHELERGEGQVSVQRGLVPVEEGRRAFCPDNGARGVERAPVVVSGSEMGVVVASLEL